MSCFGFANVFTQYEDAIDVEMCYYLDKIYKNLLLLVGTTNFDAIFKFRLKRYTDKKNYLN